MIGVGTFDPREILNPKTRDNAIMEMINIKVSKEQLHECLKDLDLVIPEFNYDDSALKVIEKAEAHFYTARTERNRDTKSLGDRAKSERAAIPEKPELLMPDRTTESLLITKENLGTEFKELKQTVKDWETVQEAVKQAEQDVSEFESQKKEIEEKIKVLNEKYAVIVDKNANKKAEISRAQTKNGAKPDIITGTERITKKGQEVADELQRRDNIKSVERQEDTVKALDEAHQNAKGKSDALGFAVNRLRGPFKQQIMFDADLPIKGLGYSNGKFNLAGRSLDLLSSSEALIIGLQLVRKKNPQSNIICIDGGECLDDETYANLQKAVGGDGFNYFLTKVGKRFKSETDTVIEMKKGSRFNEY